MRKLKIFLLAATVIGFVFLAGGCKKTYTTNVTSADSVLSSGWFVPTLTLDPTDSLFEGTVSNSAITQAIVDNGIVLAYVGVVESLPNSTASDTTGELAVEYGVYTTYQVGSLFISSTPTDYDGIGNFVFPGYDFFFRYVIVPGNVLTTMKLTPQAAKSMSYTEITKAIVAARQASPASIPQ